MGLINKLLGGAEGCREAMRDSYRQHAKVAARQDASQGSPHLIGLFGALASRYRARGKPVDEVTIWSELAPFLAMEPGTSVLALAEYAAFQEQHSGVKRPWLQQAINRALRSTLDDALKDAAERGVRQNCAWCELLDSETIAVLTGERSTGHAHTHRNSGDDFSHYSQQYNARLLDAVEKVLKCDSGESLVLTMSLYPPVVYGHAVRLGYEMAIPADVAAAFSAWFVSASFETAQGAARMTLGADASRLEIYRALDQHFHAIVLKSGAFDHQTFLKFGVELRRLTGWKQ